MQMWTLIVDGFRESKDRKIFWVLLMLSIICAAALACISFLPGKVTLLFGMWEFQTSAFTNAAGLVDRGVVAGLLIDGVLDTLLGTIGVVLTIIATAGFFVDFIRKGAIELTMSKPLARWQLFAGRYFGALTFILFQATVFVVLTFLVAGLRWGVWLPAYLWAIPLMVLLFSYFYCISVFVAVVSRSTATAIIVTLGAWFMFVAVENIDVVLEARPELQTFQSAHRAVHAAWWVVPKSQEIIRLARKLAGGTLPDGLVPAEKSEDVVGFEGLKAVEARHLALSPWSTIGSSLGFEAFVLLLAMWRFNRKDF